MVAGGRDTTSTGDALVASRRNLPYNLPFTIPIYDLPHVREVNTYDYAMHYTHLFACDTYVYDIPAHFIYQPYNTYTGRARTPLPEVNTYAYASPLPFSASRLSACSCCRPLRTCASASSRPRTRRSSPLGALPSASFEACEGLRVHGAACPRLLPLPCPPHRFPDQRGGKGPEVHASPAASR